MSRSSQLSDLPTDGDGMPAHLRPFARAEHAAALRGLAELAGARGQTLEQMAIAWTLRDPRVTTALIGAGTIDQLEARVHALAHRSFTEDELTAIRARTVDAGALWTSPAA